MNLLSVDAILTYEKMYGNMALSGEPPSITQNKSEVKKQTGKNNYTSFATYYHPNPLSKTGCPYVRKDGSRNSDLAKISDTQYLHTLCNRLIPLCILYHFTKNEQYADVAVKMIKTFFIDEETKMNPTLTYSGLVIGDNMNDLRIRGATIDTSRLCLLPDLITLLSSSKNWTIDLQNSMVLWFESLSNWFKTNPRGILQNGYSHNIRTSYINQLCSYLFFCGKSDEAKNYLDANLKNLLVTQIDNNGKQELEMNRSKNKHYSNFNLVLLMRLAKISKSLGIDVWNYQDENGRGSIRKAMNYLAYYHLNPKEWPASAEDNETTSTTRSWIKDGVALYKDDVLIKVYEQTKVHNFINVTDFISLPN